MSTEPEVQTLSFGFRPSTDRSAPMEIDSDSHRPRTYFDRSEVQFSPLTESGDVEMDGFLRGCHGIVDFVGFFGSAFTPVKHDINGNIAKVERVYQTDHTKYVTVKRMLDAELADWPGRMGPATEGLLYLKRALEFVCAFLESIVNDHKTGNKSNSLVSIGKDAYGRTLKRHHKKLERGVFKVVIHAMPYRKDLLKTIANGRIIAEQDCVDDIERYLETCKANIQRVVELYIEYGFEK